ncbi:MAG: sulfurtransferase [Bryobacteraceae bacterium]|jgi:thiosulfate/3-mercaptopyruvate sulfurtransferase
MNLRKLLAFAAAGGLLAASAAAGPRLEMLVSTGWLADHLNDRNVVVLHIARDRAHYDAGHIPGACFVPWSELMVTREGVPNELPPVADIKRLFERCGVSDYSRVVLYGDTLLLSATRAWFTLDYLGHGGHAALLDGGLEKWRAEQRPVSKEEPVARQGRLTPRIRPDAVVGLEQMRDLSRVAVNVPSSKVVILDSRSPAEFRKGHIPGAVNVFWPDTITSKEMPTLRPLAEVERIYQAAGVAHGRTIVAYCVAGVQATQTYFVLKYLGYDVRLYDGSFSEWSRAKDAPIQ